MCLLLGPRACFFAWSWLGLGLWVLVPDARRWTRAHAVGSSRGAGLGAGGGAPRWTWARAGGSSRGAGLGAGDGAPRWTWARAGGARGWSWSGIADQPVAKQVGSDRPRTPPARARIQPRAYHPPTPVPSSVRHSGSRITCTRPVFVSRQRLVNAGALPPKKGERWVHCRKKSPICRTLGGKSKGVASATP
jgi:hypothetical protein